VASGGVQKAGKAALNRTGAVGKGESIKGEKELFRIDETFREHPTPKVKLKL